MNDKNSPFLKKDFKERVLDLSVNGIYVYDLIKGANIYINKQYTNLTGYTLEDINNMSQEDFFSLFHPEEQEIVAKHMQEVINLNFGEFSEIEYRFKKSNGEWMWCLSRDGIISVDENGVNTQFIGTFIDITNQKQAEISLHLLNNELENLVKQRTSELEKSLKTQELLMKEIHHRVKNNLQLLISMFSLYVVKEKNKNIVNAIEECKNKIYSLALIYQNLYHHKDLSNINLKDYLSQLCRHIEDSMKGNNLVSLKLKLQSTKISIDNAVTLGLITNELITNCYKHAFPGNCEGIISVDLTLIDKKLTLNIKDNGIGLPQSFNIKNTGFGLEMVSALVGQMNATMEVINSNGLLFSITFTTYH